MLKIKKISFSSVGLKPERAQKQKKRNQLYTVINNWFSVGKMVRKPIFTFDYI